MRKSSNNFDTDNSGGELFPLSPVNDKKIEASFTSPDLSSQGGLLLMREVEQKNGFISFLLLFCMEKSGVDDCFDSFETIKTESDLIDVSKKSKNYLPTEKSKIKKVVL